MGDNDFEVLPWDVGGIPGRWRVGKGDLWDNCGLLGRSREKKRKQVEGGGGGEAYRDRGALGLGAGRAVEK